MIRVNKPVSRISHSMIREQGKTREVVVTINGTYLSFRLLGTRKKFTMDISGAYQRAAMLEAEKVRAEKRAAKKAAKGKG